MLKNQVINKTGEVSEAPKFRSMWSNPFGFITQDLSDKIEDVYEEIAPFAIDAATGDFLNKSSVPILKKTGKVNVWEKIQSFASDVDLYKILEKFAYSGDNAILNARECSYGDVSNLPDNLNDFAQSVNIQLDKLKSINPELGKMIIDDKYTAQDIENKAKEIMNQRIDSLNNKESEDNK